MLSFHKRKKKLEAGILWKICKPNPNSTPGEAIISQFGAAAAIYDISKRWGMVEIIDSAAAKKNQGALCRTLYAYRCY